MAETFPYVESDAPVSHPGWLLAEELEVRGMSQRQFARQIGCPFEVINEIVRGRRAITPDIAQQIEGGFGTPAYLWLGLQAKYDLDVAGQKKGPPGVAS